MDPLVSCLCLTEGRVPLLKRAIECFRKQTYTNLELVIVYNPEDQETLAFISKLGDENVRSFELPAQNMTLGEKRNYSIEVCSGEYFCQWDDDDWYHADRVDLQFRALESTKKDVCVLSHIIIYDTYHKKAYYSFERLWENTIMYKIRTKRLVHRYKPLNKREDTYFLMEAVRQNLVFPLTTCPLYIYNFHGSNTCDNGHFNNLLSYSQELSESSSSAVTECLFGSNYLNSCNLLRQDTLLHELDYLYEPPGI